MNTWYIDFIFTNSNRQSEPKSVGYRVDWLQGKPFFIEGL